MLDGQHWTACYTDPGAERDVQIEIEKRDIGTLLPTYVTTWLFSGKVRAQETPILGRYVLIAVPAEGAERLIGIEGVQGILAGQITDREIERLMLAHMTGAYNQVRTRAANGRFASSAASPRRKQKKRRRRPRAGKHVRNRTHSTRNLAA